MRNGKCAREYAVADDDEGKADYAPDTEAPEDVMPAVKQVRIVCGSGSVNIRVGNDAEYGRIASVKSGTTFEWIATSENGWHAECRLFSFQRLSPLFGQNHICSSA